MTKQNAAWGVAAFMGSCGEAGKKPATVRRYLATIASAHRAAKNLNPNDDEDVKLVPIVSGRRSRWRMTRWRGGASSRRWM